MIGNLIIEHHARHLRLSANFENIDQQPAGNRPTAYQAAIYECELDLVRTLDVIFERKQVQLNYPIDLTSHQAKLEQLQARSLLTYDNPYPLLRAMRFYIVIIASVFDMRMMTNKVDDTFTNDFIDHSLQIIKHAHEFRRAFGSLTYQATDHITSDFFDEVRLGVNGMIADIDPTRESEHLLFVLSTLLLEKTMKLRDDTTRKQKSLAMTKEDEQSPKDVCNAQQAKDQYNHLSAIARQLNLAQRQDDRRKYQKQSIRCLAEVGVLDPYCLSPDILIPDSLPFLRRTTTSLFDQVGDLEFYFTTLKLLSAENRPVPDQLRSQLIRQLRNLKIDAQLVTFYALTSNKIDTVTISHIVADLQLVTWVTQGLLHMIGGYNDDPRARYLMLSSITPELIQELFYGRMRSDAVCTIFNSLLQLRTQAELARAKTNEARLTVFSRAAMTISTLIASLAADGEPLKPANLIAAKQFIMDYFFGCVLLCRNADESSLFVRMALRFPLLTMVAGEKNESIYHFCFSILLKSANDTKIIDQINEAYLQSFEKKLHDYTFDLCKSAVESLSTSSCRLNVVTRLIFTDLSLLFINYAEKHGNDNKKKIATELKNQRDVFFNHIHDKAQTLLAITPPNRVGAARVNVISSKANKASANKKKNKESKKKSKRKNKKNNQTPTNQTSNRKKYVDIHASYEAVAEFHDKDINAMVKFYKGYLYNNRDIKKRSQALLGMLECLPKITDKNKQKVTLREINVAASGILEGCKRGMFIDEYNTINNRYQELIAPWLAKEISAAPKNKIQSVATRPEPISTKKAIRKETPSVRPPLKSVATPPTPSKQVRLFKPAPNLAPLDPFKVMRKNIRLAIKLTNLQQLILKMMHESKMFPLIHGGAVVDTIFNIPPRDIDLLCFCPITDLKAFVERNADKLHIRLPIRVTSSNVCVINFIDGTDDDSLEIASLPTSDPSCMGATLRQLARDFGINLILYYDTLSNTIIDPLNQYQRISEERTLDVGQVCSIDMRTYFKDKPERILDCVYKVAKYRKHGVQFTMSDDVKSAIIDYQLSQRTAVCGKIDIIRFNKLFMQGHATEVFTIMHQQLQLLPILFPQIAAADLVLLHKLCTTSDAMINLSTDVVLSENDRQLLRSSFIAIGLYPSFTGAHDASALLENKNGFYTECAKFLRKRFIYISDELMNHVQNKWWDRLTFDAEPTHVSLYRP